MAPRRKLCSTSCLSVLCGPPAQLNWSPGSTSLLATHMLFCALSLLLRRIPCSGEGFACELCLSSQLGPHQNNPWIGGGILSRMTCNMSTCIASGCLVTRKAVDAKHIASRECKGDLWGGTLSEGEYFCHKGHVLRLSFRPWKRAARRPALSCCRCPF